MRREEGEEGGEPEGRSRREHMPTCVTTRISPCSSWSRSAAEEAHWGVGGGCADYKVEHTGVETAPPRAASSHGKGRSTAASTPPQTEPTCSAQTYTDTRHRTRLYAYAHGKCKT